MGLYQRGKPTMKYRLLTGAALVMLGYGITAPALRATPAGSSAARPWTVPVGLLKRAFPVIYGNSKAAAPPTTMQLDYGIHIPLLTGLQILKQALAAPTSGAAGDAALIVCQASRGAGDQPHVLTCRSNAAYLHERRNLSVPDVPPECTMANPSAADIDRSYREGIVPYTVAGYFDLARVNPGALQTLMQQVPTPQAMLCPQIRRSD